MVRRNDIILFVAGLALGLSQFLMIREFVTVLYGEEVVIVLVTTAFFFGISVGYYLSLKLSPKVFKMLFTLSAFLNLTFPISYRYLAVWLNEFESNGIWLILMLFFYALSLSSIFSIFLPKLIEEGGGSVKALKRYYTIELAGFITAFIVIGISWNHESTFLLPFYWSLIFVLLASTVETKAVVVTYLLAMFGTVHFLADNNISSAVRVYKQKHHLKNPSVVYSINSPYQRVEVVEYPRGNFRLYLDGLLNLDSKGLEDLNYFIAKLPAILIKPDRTLIVGNGTLSSVKKVYPYSKELISVELDSGVVKAGKLFYTTPASLIPYKNWTLFMDDGKQFIRKSKKKFDLVIMDIPSPLTIQEAYLHTKEFYSMVRDKMSSNGVIAVQLSGKLQKNDRTPARVTAALSEAFDDVMVIYSKRADRGFAYASRKLPFTKKELIEVSRNYDKKVTVITSNRLGRYLKRAVPFSVDRMDIVLRRGLERFMGRYFDK